MMEIKLMVTTEFSARHINSYLRLVRATAF